MLICTSVHPYRSLLPDQACLFVSQALTGLLTRMSVRSSSNQTCGEAGTFVLTAAPTIDNLGAGAWRKALMLSLQEILHMLIRTLYGSIEFRILVLLQNCCDSIHTQQPAGTCLGHDERHWRARWRTIGSADDTIWAFSVW